MLMRAACLLLICVVSAERRASSDGSTPEWAPPEFDEDNLLVLGASNFSAVLKYYPQMLVTFYAPWCSYSKAIAPEVAAAADKLVAEGSPARLAKVDAIAEEALATEYGVDSYPTLLWFDGTDELPRPYRAGRTQDALIAWVTRRVRTGSPSLALESVPEAEAWVREMLGREIVGGSVAVAMLVLLPAADDDGAWASAYEAAARHSDPALCAHTTSVAVYAAAAELAATTVRKQLALGAPPTRPGAAARALVEPPALGDSPTAPAAMLLKPHDERIAYLQLNEGFRLPAVLEPSLAELVAQHATPLLVPFLEQYEDVIYGGAVAKQLVVIGSARAIETAREALEAVAGAYRGTALVVTADVEDDASDGLVEFFRVDVAAAQAQLHLFGFDVTTETKYAVPAAAAAAARDERASDLEDALAGFIQSLVDGDAPVLHVSAPAPTANVGPVVTVVADTFEELVRAEGVDVLLMITADWCGHCKAIAPAYTALARKLADAAPAVVVATLDGDYNEVPALEYDGYPTVLLYTASNKVIEAGSEVEKTAEALEAFVRAHAEAPLAPADNHEKHTRRGKEEL